MENLTAFVESLNDIPPWKKNSLAHALELVQSVSILNKVYILERKTNWCLKYEYPQNLEHKTIDLWSDLVDSYPQHIFSLVKKEKKIHILVKPNENKFLAHEVCWHRLPQENIPGIFIIPITYDNDVHLLFYGEFDTAKLSPEEESFLKALGNCFQQYLINQFVFQQKTEIELQQHENFEIFQQLYPIHEKKRDKFFKNSLKIIKDNINILKKVNLDSRSKKFEVLLNNIQQFRESGQELSFHFLTQKSHWPEENYQKLINNDKKETLDKKRLINELEELESLVHKYMKISHECKSITDEDILDDKGDVWELLNKYRVTVDIKDPIECAKAYFDLVQTQTYYLGHGLKYFSQQISNNFQDCSKSHNIIVPKAHFKEGHIRFKPEILDDLGNILYSLAHHSLLDLISNNKTFNKIDVHFENIWTERYPYLKIKVQVDHLGIDLSKIIIDEKSLYWPDYDSFEKVATIHERSVNPFRTTEGLPFIDKAIDLAGKNSAKISLELEDLIDDKDPDNPLIFYYWVLHWPKRDLIKR